MSRRLTPRGAERREQLVAEATRLFAGSGYHRTSVADVCDACGVGKGVFYWYFDSKDELFRAILVEGLTALRRAQRKALDGVDSPVERIVAGIRATLDFLEANPELFNLLEFAAADATFADAYRTGVEVAVEDTARHLKDAMAAGDIGDGDPYVLGHGVTTITMHFFRRFLVPDPTARPLTPTEVVDAAVAFCLHGISGPVNAQ